MAQSTARESSATNSLTTRAASLPPPSTIPARQMPSKHDPETTFSISQSPPLDTLPPQPHSTSTFRVPLHAIRYNRRLPFFNIFYSYHSAAEHRMILWHGMSFQDFRDDFQQMVCTRLSREEIESCGPCFAMRPSVELLVRPWWWMPGFQRVQVTEKNWEEMLEKIESGEGGRVEVEWWIETREAL